MTAHVLREEGLKTRKVVAVNLPESHSDRPIRPGVERAQHERKSRQSYVAHSTVDPIASNVSTRRERGETYALLSEKPVRVGHKAAGVAPPPDGRQGTDARDATDLLDPRRQPDIHQHRDGLRHDVSRLHGVEGVPRYRGRIATQKVADQVWGESPDKGQHRQAEDLSRIHLLVRPNLHARPNPSLTLYAWWRAPIHRIPRRGALRGCVHLAMRAWRSASGRGQRFHWMPRKS